MRLFALPNLVKVCLLEGGVGMPRSIEAVIDADGRIRLKRSVRLDQSHRAVVTILGPVEEDAIDGINRSAFPSVVPLLEELEREEAENRNNIE